MSFTFQKFMRRCVKVPSPATYFCFPSAASTRTLVSYWRMYMHVVLVYRSGGLDLSWNSVARLIDLPDMTIAFYRGRKTTKQHQLQDEAWSSDDILSILCAPAICDAQT